MAHCHAAASLVLNTAVSAVPPSRKHAVPCQARLATYPTRRFSGRSAAAAAPAHLTTSSEKAAPGPVDQRSNGRIGWRGVHHVALLVENLRRSLNFYQGILGLELNPDRPDHKLPYKGAWVWIGTEMIHLMELPNPDSDERPEHGGRDRHFCIGVESIAPIVNQLRTNNIPYTMSMSGRPAVFFRDPDMNCLECVETKPWR